jgi:hypothetical protein
MFIALATGEIFIFDLIALAFCPMTVPFEKVWPKAEKREDPITDIKCHWKKQHRLLLSFQRQGVAVFSLNKDRTIRQVNIKDDKDNYIKGKVLACEWIGPACKEFIVGYEKATVEIFKAESNDQKPVKVLPFGENNVKEMSLNFFMRPLKGDYCFLIIKFKKAAEANPLV